MTATETDTTLYDVTILVQETRQISIRAENETEARAMALKGQYIYFDNSDTQTLSVQRVEEAAEKRG